MDTLLPSGTIFRELQDIHDTGYFSAQPSLEDHWQQVRRSAPRFANFSSIENDRRVYRLCASRLSSFCMFDEETFARYD